MDVDNPTKTLVSTISEAARRAAASESAKKKSTARKNSSGGAKNKCQSPQRMVNEEEANQERRGAHLPRGLQRNQTTTQHPVAGRIAAAATPTSIEGGTNADPTHPPATRGTSRRRGQDRRYYANNRGISRPRRPERPPSPYSRGYKDQGYFEERDYYSPEPDYYYH